MKSRVPGAKRSKDEIIEDLKEINRDQHLHISELSKSLSISKRYSEAGFWFHREEIMTLRKALLREKKLNREVKEGRIEG